MVAMTSSQAHPSSIRRPEVARPSITSGNMAGNVALPERWIGGMVGAGCVLLGLKQRGVLGLLMMGLGGMLLYRSISGYCPAYGALGISTERGREPASPEDYFDRGIHVETSCVVTRSPEELYRYWRNLENLPQIMGHVKHVEVLSDTRSRWTVNGPLGDVSWEAEIIHDQPGALLAWKSVENADVDNAGSVRFVPVDNGTEVRVVLDYIPPAGQLGKAVAQLFGRDANTQIREDLRRFKQRIEAQSPQA